MKRRFLYRCIVIGLCFNSCYKPHYPALATIYLSQEYKDYVVFQPGSYWIYQDSANSSERDSINLTNHNDYIEPQVGRNYPPREYFNNLLWSSRAWYLEAKGSVADSTHSFYTIDSDAKDI